MSIIKVTLDITGFFFHRTVEIDTDKIQNPTVKHVMDAAENANNAAFPIFKYTDIQSPPGSNRRFVKSISVEHKNGSAISRQTPVTGRNARVYPDGIYTFTDDELRKTSSGAFVPADANRFTAQVWQYYIYDKDFKDLSRSEIGEGGQQINRKIIPHSTSDVEGIKLGNEFTVVWRLITLVLRPNGSYHRL